MYSVPYTQYHTVTGLSHTKPTATVTRRLSQTPRCDGSSFISYPLSQINQNGNVSSVCIPQLRWSATPDE